MKQMIKVILFMLLIGRTAVAPATERSNAREFWQSHDHSVVDKAAWATTYFATNACTFVDVSFLLGKPDSTSRTGTDLAGFRMQHDAIYRFSDGTIDLVFLLPSDKTSLESAILYSVRHITHPTLRGTYKAKWIEARIENRQPTAAVSPTVVEQ